MQQQDFTSPFSVEIVSVLLKTQRFSTEFDLKAVVAELSIYEHLDKPYLTASMIVADIDKNIDLASEINILGTERVDIIYKVSNAQNGTIRKSFIISEVSRQAKDFSGDEVMFLEMIEDHAYRSTLMRISKSFRDTKRVIIDKLVGPTGRRVKLHEEMLEHDDKITRVLVPNMTPLQAANWIKDSMTTEDGYPFYLYSTIADDVLRLHDLKTMLSLTPMNMGLPGSPDFTFGQLHDFKSRIETGFPDIANLLTITKFNIVQDQRQLHLARKGMTRSKYNFFDTTTGKNTKIDFSMQEVFQDVLFKNLLEQRGVFGGKVLQPTYDTTALLDEKNTALNNLEDDRFSTREITQFCTSRQFNDYYETRSYSEARTAQQHKNKIKATALRHWLLKSSVDIEAPGKIFVNAPINNTIGNKITIAVRSSVNFNTDADFNRTIDMNKSGEYLIYSTKHTISGNQSYKVELTLAKLGSLTKGKTA